MGPVLAMALALAACTGSPEVPLPHATPTEATLRPGEVHRYSLSLREGSGVRIVATQRSSDLVLSLHGEGGEVARQDRRDSGQELLLAAAARGPHEVHVLAAEGEVSTGPYVLEAEEIPPGDPRRQAFDLHLSGRALARDPHKPQAVARERLEAAGAAWTAAGNPALAAHARLEAGEVSRVLREPAAAAEAFQQAAAAFGALGLAAERATARNLQGEALAEQGDYRAARDAWKDALAGAASLTPRGRAAVRYNHGASLKEVGEYAASLEIIREAIPEFRRLGMTDHELVARTALADIFLMRRELPAALEELTAGLASSRTHARPAHEARFLQRMGILYTEAGDDEAAADHWRRSLTLHQAAGNRIGEGAVRMQLGDLAVDLGDFAEAERCYRSALETLRAIGQKQGEARALRRLANLLTDRGQPAPAIELHQRSLAILREVGGVQGEVLTLAGLARAKSKAGDRAGARRALEEALARTRASGAGLHETEILGELALLDRQRGALDQALAGLDRAIAMLERGQRAALVPSLQATLSADARRWYAERTDLLMEQKATERALESSERARARALLNLLAESRVDVRKGVDPALLRRYRDLQVRLSEADRARSPEVAELTARLHSLETEIRRTSPAYAALTQPTPLSVEEIRRRVLDDRTVLLEFSLGEARSWVFALTRDTLVTAPLPGAAEIEAAAQRLHGRLSASPAPADAEAAILSALLLRPLQGRLTGPWREHRLAIVADGALRYVPFGVLSLGSPPRRLIEDHEIVTLPSASVLDVLRREVAGRPPATRTLALIGDPVFAPDDPRVRRRSGAARAGAVLPGGTRGYPRLPFSREEVRTIAALLPPPQVVLATDFRASRPFVMGGTLGGCRILHIATHGLLNTTQPDLSGVVLSLVDEEGRPQDGFLRLQDIYNLQLSADLVVLSACRTALGRPIAGEGLVGLTRGFMHAGAPRVVASLWRVDDSATARLMAAFYRGMLREGLPAAAALRAAELELARDRRFASPFYWAGFTLEGDWR